MSNINVTIQLDPKQAEAYLRWLVSQYEQAMADCWYSDKYRYVPEGFRGNRVLQDHPHIAGIRLQLSGNQLGERRLAGT